MHLLLVEDDPSVAHGVAAGLRLHGFTVDHAETAAAAQAALAASEFDLAVLDLGLPDGDGMDLLARWRARGIGMPLLVLTARDAVSDRVRGLQAGADDYLLKPFAMAELLARMRALLRRKGGSATPLLGNGVLALDPATREASAAGAAPVRLSQREFALLHALLIRPGAILSRSELEDRIYGWGEEVQSNAVEFLIHALRRKLGSEVIKNVRGVGWMVSRSA